MNTGFGLSLSSIVLIALLAVVVVGILVAWVIFVTTRDDNRDDQRPKPD